MASPWSNVVGYIYMAYAVLTLLGFILCTIYWILYWRRKKLDPVWIRIGDASVRVWLWMFFSLLLFSLILWKVGGKQMNWLP